MLSFGVDEIKSFLGARSRADMTAVDALNELRIRSIVNMTEVERHAQRCCAAAGEQINKISAHRLAEIYDIQSRANV
jgi:hypothetical protein